jgi:hypothetical protein
MLDLVQPILNISGKPNLTQSLFTKGVRKELPEI